MSVEVADSPGMACSVSAHRHSDHTAQLATETAAEDSRFAIAEEPVHWPFELGDSSGFLRVLSQWYIRLVLSIADLELPVAFRTDHTLQSPVATHGSEFHRSRLSPFPIECFSAHAARLASGLTGIAGGSLERTSRSRFREISPTLFRRGLEACKLGTQLD
jgi:hypothetical protein